MARVSAVAPVARASERAVRVLVVVEDRALANTVDLTLRHGVYVRRSAGTVADAKASIAEWKPHLLLLDIDLEAGAGIQLVDEARAGLVDELDPRAGLEVDIEEQQVRLPLGDRGLGVRDGAGGPADVDSVPEGEVNGIRERPILDDDEHADRSLGGSGNRGDGGHSGHRADSIPGCRRSGRPGSRSAAAASRVDRASPWVDRRRPRGG